ncbi:MAG: acyl-CoA dehydrogenase family protein [Desulfobacter sp.]|nr:MAG: acyl-CoA dehydrogenase family protein [Desulfobacter sp.]
MDFSLTREQAMLLDSLRDMGRRENFKELAVEIDKTGEFPHDLMKQFARMDLLGMTLSADHGGQDMDALTAVLAIEALARFSPMIAAPVFESNVGPARVVSLFGTEEQKQRIIPGVCAGDLSVSVCMTEPEAGSDLTNLSTNAEDRGGYFELTGTKVFITGGGLASHYLVYTRFNGVRGYKGIGALLVEKGSEGFSFGPQETFLGLRGMPSCALYFDKVKVPRENLVVKAGDFGQLMLAFDIERCGNAAMCLGIAGAAFEEAQRYAMERKAFDRPICEFQNTQFAMADMAMKLDAAKLLVYRAASGAGQGLPSVYEASMGKCYANEMVKEVTDTALQLFGGYGYSTDYPMERMLRDARAWQVAGGSLQMLRITMASIIFGRRFSQKS